MNSPHWFELAVLLGLFAVGHVFFGPFEAGTSKRRRLMKMVVVCGGGVLLSATAGRLWFFAVLAAGFVFVAVVHAWWLPRKGINGWTAEPREKYYRLRGWKMPTGARDEP